MNSLVGESISHYTILECLGGGGMGIVYKARDIRLDRDVALKFLPPDLTRDPEARLRFIHEAKAASALQHENICVVHDIDQTDDDQTYIVLEFYDGGTIKSEIAGGPLPLDKAIDIARQVGEGLAEAHRHDIVHRDIKPANIMLSRRGRVKIVDFGVALLTGATRVTTDGRKVGTITHMSPEQTKGDNVDHRTDIWSLGVLLYEMIAGRLPFEGSYEQAIIYSILNADPPPVSDLRAGVPKRVDNILRKALAKDPNSRYQDVDEMVDDLYNIFGRSIGSGTSTRANGAPQAGRSGQGWIIGAFVTAVLLAAAGIWLFKGPDSLQKVDTGQLTLKLQPVRNLSGQPRIDEWTQLIERTYLPNQFTDKSDVLLFQQESSRSDVNFDITGDIVRAESTFTLQLRLQEPESGRLRYVATASLSRIEDLENAVTRVSRNILWFLQIRVQNRDLDPWMPRRISDSTTVAFLKAMTYILTGEPGGRVFLYEAIRLDSTFVAPRVWLIPWLAGQHDAASREEAERHYRALRSLNAGVTPFELSMIDLARCYLYGNLPCRVTALEMGLRFAPGNRIVLENLGGAYAQLEKFDQAIEAYGPIVRSGMPYPPAYPEYARVLIKVKRFDEARAVLRRSLDIRPVHPDAYDLLAAFLWKDGDSAAAKAYELRSLEAMAPRKRTWGDVRESTGRILSDMGESGLAVRFLREAVAEEPDAPSAHSALAHALLLSNDLTGAEKEADMAVLLDGSSAEAFAVLAQIGVRCGKLEEAQSHIRSYLKIDSVSVTALDFQRKLGAIELTLGPRTITSPHQDRRTDPGISK